MKTQTSGISNMSSDDASSGSLLKDTHERKLINWVSNYLAEAYNNYRTNRENGEAQDSPSGDLQYDGQIEWKLQPDGYYYVVYTEGPKDKLWMETKDRNYVFRLEREGRLNAAEPNLHTETPKLHQEIITYRNGGEKENQALCIDHLKSHWFGKEHHLAQAELLLRFHANPNNVLLQLAVDSDEIDAITQFFQIVKKYHLIINRAILSEAINKAYRKNYSEVVDFLTQTLCDHQYNDLFTQAKQKTEKEEQPEEEKESKYQAKPEKTCNMKTQVYGISDYSSQIISWGSLEKIIDFPEFKTVTHHPIKESYNNYRANRENGEPQDDPPGELKYDGKIEWEHQIDGFFHLKYTEGPNDKLWMEMKDRNYVFRLEREGRLDAVIPSLHTEMPKLYQEVMAYRDGGKKENQDLCIDHLKSHWFRKEYHLEQAELLLRFYANPNNVLLQLAIASDEINAIARLFQIVEEYHLNINRAILSEAINKASGNHHVKVVNFLQQILLDFQHNDLLTQAEQKTGEESKYQAKLDKRCNLKTQAFGISDRHSNNHSSFSSLYNAHKEKENNWTSVYLTEAYHNYRANRENGEPQDDPPYELKYDGNVAWKKQPDGYYHVEYTEGSNDKLWMEAKDRNYVFRLEREGHLDAVIPSLQNKMPKLYQEAMAYRNGGKKEYQDLCVDHLKSHWFKKEYHLEQAELLLLQFDANPNHVLLKLAGDSDEINPIAQLFQILHKHHWIIDKATVAKAINKANKNNHARIVNFLQQIYSDFQYNDLLTQAEQKAKEESEYQAELQLEQEQECEKKAYEEEQEYQEYERQKRVLAETEAKARAEARAEAEAEAKVKLKAERRKAEEENLEREKIKQKIEAKSSDHSYLISYTNLTFEHELGRGSFGTVYYGKWQYIEVAIKQLHLYGLSAESLEEFQSKAALLTKLHHPNIVTLYGVSMDQPAKYSLVMEYMPKGSLYAVLHNKQPLDWHLRYRISMDIGAGLLYLHEQNILHGDLKSMNVLLDDHMRAKLSDFGLAKLRNESTTIATKAGGSAVGTIPWMALELFKRQSQYTKASDIYSLGMVFWEIASRLLPYADAIDPMLIIVWKNQGENENIPKDCPPKYAELITWCWETQTKRPTANQVVEILEQTLTENTQSSVDSTIYQNGPSYQQDALNLAEENKSIPNYQLNTLSPKQQLG